VFEHRVVAALLRDDDRVLLCHRSATRRWYPDVWDFPGGHVEAGEGPLVALTRELREELGVEVEVLEAEPIIRVMEADARLDLSVWVCTSWQGVIENLQPEEHDEFRWFTRSELEGLAMADPGYLPVLKRLLE
jgi:8-oxo-dGTP diphosphatase